jgi:RNA polymerase sigma-70 factor (ECF subfamily)
MSSWSRALDDLVRERGAALFGYAYVLTGNAADAEDLVQSALVRTFRTGRATRGIDSTHAYVKRAIASAFVDAHRRSQARPQRASGDAGDVAASPGAAVSSDHAPAVDEALDLHQAILLLPPRERACIVLRYLEDKPVAAIAGELGLATGTVKRYLSDAVATLRTSADIDFTTDETIPVTSRQGGTL